VLCWFGRVLPTLERKLLQSKLYISTTDEEEVT
jgi:hypothetical protein